MSSRLGRSLTVVLSSLLLAAVLAGCGGDDTSAGDGPTTPSTSEPADGCDADLPADAAEDLLGEPAEEPSEKPFSSITACRWDGAETDAWVQVLDVPAGEWAKILPDAIGTLLDSGMQFEGRDKLEAGLALIEKGGTLDDGEACELFTTMVVSLQGMEAGTTEIVSYLPSREDVQAVNAQRCEDGQYRSVQLAKDGIEVGTETENRIQDAMNASAD